SALVPNARANGNTQISIGTGYYRGTTGFAVGGFHYLNDDVLLNAGAAYAGNGSATFKSGVTFGF
ncbi:MAG: YadA C-terminal domain-containing protein, partial [Alphaproteobacteria bacterium]|nr:YadA C-terminal domain-containing protein [Alphaproteobacteria bacterium]